MHKDRLKLGFACSVSESELEERSPGRRHCGSCQKTVHHLSVLTEREARAFLRSTADDEVCVSYYVDDGDNVCFAQPPAAAWRRAPAAVAFAVAVAACSEKQPPISDPPASPGSLSATVHPDAASPSASGRPDASAAANEPEGEHGVADQKPSSTSATARPDHRSEPVIPKAPRHFTAGVIRLRTPKAPRGELIDDI